MPTASFDAGKLALWPAAKLAGQSRVEFQGALADRKNPICRTTLQDLADDLAALHRLRP